jgi:SRSO17 transposase
LAIAVCVIVLALTSPQTINLFSRTSRVDCSCRWWRLALTTFAWIDFALPLLRARCAFPKARSYFLSCPAGTSMETLVAVEGRRWAIEDSFETAKNELGLDHNESRSWHGWHRHVSLVMLAFAMLATIRHHANQPAASQTPSRLTRTRKSRSFAGRSRKSAALPHVLRSGASNHPISSRGRFGGALTKLPPDALI